MESKNSKRHAVLRRTVRSQLKSTPSLDVNELLRTPLVASVAIFIAAIARADASADAASLKKLSVEELMNLEVTSVSKSEERIGVAAAAISVISSETIRRLGANSIPEALRGAQGLHVAEQNATQWAVSSRGFSSVNSEKLLVLSDTRSVYTPLYSGVFWDAQDYLMEDIDRIEVIRGPGASLWGSNAVNGVINISTKSAHDTLGAYAEGGAGTEERIFGGVRYGGQIGDFDYRVFAKYFDRDGSAPEDPIRSDESRLSHVGFRMDGALSTIDSLTVQGDLYDGTIGRRAPTVNVIGRPGPQGKLEVFTNGGNVLGRWRRQLGDGSDLQLRAYYDRTRRDDPSFIDSLDTIDVDFQHRFPFASRQDITWGLNYRHTSNRNEGKIIFRLDPPASNDSVASGFLQDQIAVTDSVRVTAGTKIEHNDFSGFEVQPSVSVAWEISPSQTLWSAVSRAVRVPTRLERDIAVEATPPGSNPSALLAGNRDFDSEEMIAYEAGFRWQARETVYLGIAAYFNRYHGLASLELGNPAINTTTGQIVFPITNENLGEGKAAGVESLVTYTPVKQWRLTFVHTYTNLDIESSGLDVNRSEFLEGSTPRHQFGLQSFLDLPLDFQFDAQLRRMSDIKSIPAIVSREGLPGYTELDLRVAWLGWDNVELSVVGKNLLHDEHIEFGDPATRGEIERAVYGKVAWRY